MALNTFTVNYPRGFLYKKESIVRHARVYTYSPKEIAEYHINVLTLSSLVKKTSITLSMEQLISTFYKIINTYKLTPDTYLALNNISDILTTEESVIKYALVKLNGTHGRSTTVKNTDISTTVGFPIITYNPILKDIKKYLSILFNKFLNHKAKNKEDIIMYEGHQLFIHLFAIIIDSFYIPNPLVQIKKDCTDTFAMITLLELLLNKKYKNIIKSHINNPQLHLTLNNNNTINASECFEDDDWDIDYLEMSKTRTKIIKSELIEKALHPDRISGWLDYNSLNSKW